MMRNLARLAVAFGLKLNWLYAPSVAIARRESLTLSGLERKRARHWRPPRPICERPCNERGPLHSVDAAFFMALRREYRQSLGG